MERKYFYYAVVLFVLTLLLFAYWDRLSLSPCVAVIPIEGEITTQGVKPALFEEGIPSSRDIAEAIRKADEDPNVKAIVVEINSPGGSVVATREIWQALKEVEKPKVAYLREVAASGGYYVATAADYIVADPNTMTGSIGVIAAFTNLEGLFEKIGVKVNVIKAGKYKDIGSPFRNMTEEERAMLEEMINETYQEFLSVIEEGRGSRLSPNWKSYADGRVMSGRQALQIGFVDSLGSLEDAVEKAKEMANATEAEKCPIDPLTGSFDIFSLSSFLPPIKVAPYQAGLYYYWG